MNKVTYDVIRESQKESEVKNGFKRIEEIYGRDFVMAAISTPVDIKDAISIYSNAFDNVTYYDIYTTLLKGSVLSSTPLQKSIYYANSKINEGKMNNLMMDIEASIPLRVALVENLLDSIDSRMTNIDLYNQIDHRDRVNNVFRALSIIENYSETVRLQNSVLANVTVKKKVRETEPVKVSK